MSATFLITALLTLVAAAAAMAMRNLVHCVLSLAVALLGLASIYLQLNAQFVGLAQILVYLGAVAILILFAVLLTGGQESTAESPFSASRWVGLGTAAGVLVLIASVVLASGALRRPVSPSAEATVKQIGDRLMTDYVLPLQVIGLLLTIALIGGVILALREDAAKPGGGEP